MRIWNNLIFSVKRYFAYRKLKKLVIPAILEQSNLTVPTKDINIAFILTFLVDLITHSKDRKLVVVLDNSLYDIINNIPELDGLPIHTPHSFTYTNYDDVTILCSPLSEDNFNTMMSRCVLDNSANNYLFLT